MKKVAMTSVHDDPQREAFAGASPADWAWEAAMLKGAFVHEPGVDSGDPILTPEEWDAAGWDGERRGPKTVTEARAALAARIADPDAPDTDAVAGAYDGLGD
jgi:hypothetical protein